ncbi:hypothetical protein A2Y83_02005, partial [Candidatus Falkowbacteria bacterium RBG_13_39_14]
PASCLRRQGAGRAQAGRRQEAGQSLQQGKKRICSFYNGRAALYYALKTAGVGKGDEVIIQAYTCITVPNAVIEAGAMPVYCDIDETLNLDPDDLKKKITDKTKAVIIQHTFGTPAKIDEIREICEGYPLSQRGEINAPIILIEDCAHSLGAKYKGRPIGTFGDISMFSFGRDKVISSVNGGMMRVNNENLRIGDSHLKGDCHLPAQTGLPAPPYLLIIRNLLYPILAEISLKWYNKLKIGKIIMYASKKLRLFPLILSKEEKMTSPAPRQNDSVGPVSLTRREAKIPPLNKPACAGRGRIGGVYRMPNVLAYLLVKQFEKLDEYNEHRKKIAEFYDKQLASVETEHCVRLWRDAPSLQGQCAPIFLRYTIFTEKAEQIINEAKKHDIYPGDWYRTVIAPKDINLASIGYEQNMCPKAEQYAKLTVNLPNHPGITVEDAGRVVDIIKQNL